MFVSWKKVRDDNSLLIKTIKYDFFHKTCYNMCTNEEKHIYISNSLRKPFEQPKLAMRSQNFAFRLQFSICDQILADKDSSLHAFKLLLTTFWIYFLFFQIWSIFEAILTKNGVKSHLYKEFLKEALWTAKIGYEVPELCF